MSYIWLFVFQILSRLCCVYGNDVGPNFDPNDEKAYQEKYGKYPYRSYKSSNVVSPIVRRVVNSSECYDGRYIFWSPRGEAVVGPGPMILDDRGDLIWSKPFENSQPYNLAVQEYQGQPHLTYWVGDDAVGGHGVGYYYMLDSSYQEVARIEPLNGLRADLHELTITSEGTAIISIYQITSVKAYGKKLWVWDCIFQEIDIASNELLFEWRASEHHTLEETYSSIGTGGRSSHSPWDWFHLNSVQKDELGNYLVSARYTHTLSYIDGKTGEIIWILGGRRNMFTDLSEGRATDFASQHLARMHNLKDFAALMKSEIKAHDKAADKHERTEKLITMFDNGADDRIRMREFSRGLMLQISYPSKLKSSEQSEDEANAQEPRLSRRSPPFHGKVLEDHTVRLVHAYNHPDSVTSDSQGSFQVIPPIEPNDDPTIGVGFGQKPVFTEFSADGQVICDTHFAPNVSVVGIYVQSYRTLKSDWVGQPAEPPSAVLDEDEDVIYVSWNGATEVKSWQLQHTNEPRSSFNWGPVVTVPRQGFETRVQFKNHNNLKVYLRMAALDKSGKVIGVSSTIEYGEQEDLIDETTGLNSTSSAALATNAYYIMTTSTKPLKIIMLMLCVGTFSLTVYACYRWWRFGRRRNNNDTVGGETGWYRYSPL